MSKQSSRFNVLKFKPSSKLDPPAPPPKDSKFYNKTFFSRSATSLAPSLSPESVSGPATPPSPYPMPNLFSEFGKRSNGRSPVHSSSGGSLKSFNRGVPSPSVDGSTDSSGSSPNTSSHLGVYLSSNASSSSYTLGQETTLSVKSKKSVFKLANLAKRNRSRKDLSDVASASGSVSRTTSVTESEGPSNKTEGDEGVSMPWNFQHHIHVDEGYIGLPPSWSNALSQVGFSEDEIATIHARRRAAANLANPRTTHTPTSAPASSSTMLEPAPRSTSLGIARDALTIHPPSTYSSTIVGTNSAPSPRTPSFSVKSLVNGFKSSLSSDPASTKEDLGDSRSRDETGEEADQYVFVDGNGPDERGDQGMGDETLIEPYTFDSSNVSSHSHARQMSQDQETPRTPAFPQIQVHRAQSESGYSPSPSPAPSAPSPITHSASLPIPALSRGYTYPNDSASRSGPLSAPPRTPPRRIYHIANASSDGEDYSEPPPAYHSPKKDGWTLAKEKEGFAPVGVPPPPNRPIPSLPVERTLREPSIVSNQDQEASEHSDFSVGSSVDIPGTADEVLDISSHYSDNSAHGEDAEMCPQRASVLTPTPPLVIDKRLTKLATLPPRISFHQESDLEDWSASVFSVIGSKGKRASVLRSVDGTSTKEERRKTIRLSPLSESGSASASSPPLEKVAPSLPDVSFGTNFTLGSIARPSVDAIEAEHSQEHAVEETKDTSGHDADEQVVGKSTTTKEVHKVISLPVAPWTPPPLDVPPPPTLDKDPESPAVMSPFRSGSPQRFNIESLPPTPPPKPKLAPLLPPPITLVPPRTNVITGISGRSPVNSLFGSKPQPLPIPISPSQIRAQLRPAPPKSPYPPPTLPLPPLKRIPPQPNPQPPPQSQLPPLPQDALKHDFTTSQASSPDSRSTLQPARANQGDRDSGLSTMTVTPATITTAKTEVVRTAIASFIDSDTVSLASRRESILSTADPEPQTEPDMGRESPRTPEPREALEDSIVSETSLLRKGPQSKWPAPPPPPVELEADSTPRRVSRFRTTSLGRVTQLQAMASPVFAHFSQASSDTASSSTSESAPLMTPDGVNGVPCAPLAKGCLAPEARLLDSRMDTFGGADIELESGETASAAMHPLLTQLRPFIAPRNPASCFTNLVEIAEGECGSVFAARLGPGFGESQTGERPLPSGTSHVAIKRIPLPPPSSSAALSDDSPVSNKLVSVLHELSLLKDLDHEHLLLLDAVYVGSTSKDEGAESASAVDTSLWIRMELMERSLADVIGLVAEGLTLQERLLGRFASDILCGLDYLQRQHIAHRDVRSDNLLVNAAGMVKLADFSNAIRVDRNAPMVKGAVGVIYWQAPEMRAGPYNALKVDSWSLGATVWELAETVPPFSMPASPSASVSFAIQTARHVGSQWPPLTHPEHYSRAFHEFLRLCGRESAARPGPGELLSTPFIRNACGRAVILQLLSQCRAIEEAMMDEEAVG